MSVSLMVVRGDELPKTNLGKKLHPTYEASIRIKGGSRKHLSPHTIIKFFDEYRHFCNDLMKHGVGEGCAIPVVNKFPPSHGASKLGFSMGEEALQQRCFLLNKWMGEVFKLYGGMSPGARRVFEEFMALDPDKEEVSKESKVVIETILNIMRGKDTVAFADNEKVSSAASVSNSNVAKVRGVSPQRPASTPNINSRSLTPPPRPGSSTVPPAAPPRSLTPPRAQDARNYSHRFSVRGDETLKNYSAEDIADYSKEQVINNFLAVCVLRGDNMAKESVIGNETMHVGYELIARVLPLNEVTVANKGDIDEELYRNLFQFPPLSVTNTFSPYRNLRNELQALGVTSTDGSQIEPMLFHESQKDSSSSEPLTAIPVPFPRTYKRSSLGFALTEEQLEMRMVMLNNWIGYVLNNFRRLPSPAQDVVKKFMGLKSRNYAAEAAVASGANRDNRNSVEGVSAHLLEILGESHDVILRLLMNRFIPPLTAMAAARLGVPQIATSDPVGAVLEAEAQANLFGAEEALRMGNETVLNKFLCLKVEQSTYTKKNDSKLHTSYKTTISILPLARVAPEYLQHRERVDDEAYDALLKTPGGDSTWVARPFDAYRALMHNLEGLSVYCSTKESLVKAANDKNAIFVDVPFPKTYTKSSLGIGLSDAEKLDRCVVLNQWFGTLMSMYLKYPDPVRETLCRFLTLDADDPSAPQQKTMINMLSGTFELPMKPVVVNSKTNKKRRGSSAGSVDSEARDAENNEAVATKGCCIIS